MAENEKKSVRVRYENRMEKIENGTLGAVEQDLFFYICSRVREHGCADVSISFNSIRENTGFYTRSNVELAKRLRDVSKKLITFNYEHVIADGITVIGTIFSTFTINANEKTLTVAINKDLAFLLNCLDGNFTEWEFEEFRALSSAYSKRLYRIVAQWKNTGITPVYDVDEFRELMGVPKTMTNKLFFSRVVTPAMKEISKYFFGLRIVQKKAKSKGAPVVGIGFTFQRKYRVSMFM